MTRLLTCAFSSETSSCKSASSLLGRVIWFCGCGGCCACCTGCCGWLVLLLVLRLKKVRWIIRLRWISPRWVKVGKEQRYILKNLRDQNNNNRRTMPNTKYLHGYRFCAGKCERFLSATLLSMILMVVLVVVVLPP